MILIIIIIIIIIITMIIKITIYLLLKTYIYKKWAREANRQPLVLQGLDIDLVCGAYKNTNEIKTN